MVAYTLTIESLGGNGIVVPGRGFLLNNELTDFNFTDTQGGNDPNLPGPGKRPRSSMAPTIVLADGAPFLALGSPGGSTIITTVLQILVNRLDLGMDLPAAVAAPRATQRNTAAVQAEPGFDRTALQALGHTLRGQPGDRGGDRDRVPATTARCWPSPSRSRRGGGSAGGRAAAAEARPRGRADGPDPRKILVNSVNCPGQFGPLWDVVATMPVTAVTSGRRPSDSSVTAWYVRFIEFEPVAS